jgi:hypothetical protein
MGVVGNVGSVGPVGAMGLQGMQGSQGFPGRIGTVGTNAPLVSIGAQGSQGLQGVRGLQGVTGAAGFIGNQGLGGGNGIAGPSGPSGPAGLAGLQGNQGSTGPTGAVGIAGTQGLQGLQGLQGSVGSIGLSGLTGPPSLTGPVGPSGPAGNRGPSGPVGLDGSVSGPTGPVGVTGLTGAVGPSGPSGSTGTSGIQGLQGIQGSQGQIGPSGVNGTQGLQGSQGVLGMIGPIGQSGSIGNVGPSGPSGQSGTQGLQGLQGNQGFIGVSTTGSTGLQGPSGPVGVIGLMSDADEAALAAAAAAVVSNAAANAWPPGVPVQRIQFVGERSATAGGGGVYSYNGQLWMDDRDVAGILVPNGGGMWMRVDTTASNSSSRIAMQVTRDDCVTWHQMAAAVVETALPANVFRYDGVRRFQYVPIRDEWYVEVICNTGNGASLHPQTYVSGDQGVSWQPMNTYFGGGAYPILSRYYPIWRGTRFALASQNAVRTDFLAASAASDPWYLTTDGGHTWQSTTALNGISVAGQGLLLNGVAVASTAVPGESQRVLVVFYAHDTGVGGPSVDWSAASPLGTNHVWVTLSPSLSVVPGDGICQPLHVMTAAWQRARYAIVRSSSSSSNGTLQSVVSGTTTSVVGYYAMAAGVVQPTADDLSADRLAYKSDRGELFVAGNAFTSSDSLVWQQQQQQQQQQLSLVHVVGAHPIW